VSSGLAGVQASPKNLQYLKQLEIYCDDDTNPEQMDVTTS